MTTWSDATEVRERGDGAYEARLDPRWWAANGPHGGYLAGVILRAMVARAGDPARPVRAFTVHYLGRSEPGPLAIDTTIERQGKGMTSVSARAHQDGRPIAVALASFSGPRETPVAIDDAPMPAVRAPEDGLVFPDEGPGFPEFLRYLDFRGVIGARPFSGEGDAMIGAWIRLREHDPVDAPVVALYADALAPAIWPRVTTPVMITTLDLTIHFRTALPEPGRPGDAWHLGVCSSRLVRDGFVEEDGDVWDPDGRLVAHSRQLAIVRPFTR